MEIPVIVQDNPATASTDADLTFNQSKETIEDDSYEEGQESSTDDTIIEIPSFQPHKGQKRKRGSNDAEQEAEKEPNQEPKEPITSDSGSDDDEEREQWFSVEYNKYHRKIRKRIKLHTPKNWGYKSKEMVTYRTYEHQLQADFMLNIPFSAYDGPTKEIKWCLGRFPNGEACKHGDEHRNIRPHYKRYHPHMIEALGVEHRSLYTKLAVNKKYFKERNAEAFKQKDKFRGRELVTKKIMKRRDGKLKMKYKPYKFSQENQEFELDKEGIMWAPVEKKRTPKK